MFVTKSSYFSHKSGVRFEICTLSFFMASFDLSNLGGQMENLKFSCEFGVEKREDFGVPLSESINFDYLFEALG